MFVYSVLLCFLRALYAFKKVRAYFFIVAKILFYKCFNTAVVTSYLCVTKLRKNRYLWFFVSIQTMNQEHIHIYFVPGLAAGKEIFKNIKLPEALCTMHILEWLIPEKGESMSHYAARMASLVVHDNAVLVGVSFGGVVVQEMAVFLNLKKCHE